MSLCLKVNEVPIIWNDITVNFNHIDRDELVKDWQWLIGTTAFPILITSVGDMFLKETSGEIFWLITGNAQYEKVAETYSEFQSKLQINELVHEWFLIPIVAQLKDQGIILEKGKLYGFKLLPVLGGAYEANNYELTDIEVYIALSGQINFKIKDLPDGTEVNFKITD